MKLLDILTAPWAIEPSKLVEIQNIYLAHARGEVADIAAIEARLGRPLQNEPKPYVIHQGVAILQVEGVIAKRANMFQDISGGVSTELLGRDIQSALQNPAVHSILLAIDSPGGNVDGPQALAGAIRAGKAQKPIVTLASGQIASAAYLIGSAADRVYIDDVTTVSGSIGVVASHTDVSKAQEARGVKTTEITAGKYKRIATENAPLSKEGKQYLQEMVDYHYSLFVNAVATHRGVGVDAVLSNMADGRIFIGQQGIDAGLVDGIRSQAQVIAELVADHAASLADPKHVRGSNLYRVVAQQPKPPVTSKGNPMDRTQLAAEHPVLLASILAEGATAERGRILAIQGAAIPGHDALVTKLVADGNISAGDAALQIMAAEKAVLVKAHGDRQNEAPEPVKTAARGTVVLTEVQKQQQTDATALAAMPVDERCKTLWDQKSPSCADFASLQDFTAFTKAQERGAVKIHAPKA